jgi:vacuolar-type H+-ATPase subunit E/Vma4
MIRKAADMARTPLLQALKIAGLVLLAAGVCRAAGGEKEAELNRALGDIKAAVQSVGTRAATAAELLAHLQTQCDALKAEILEERRRAAAATWRQAREIRRIDSDLRLLEQATGYAVQLEDRLAYFRAAAGRLNAYRDQVRDDLRILRALDDLDSSVLLRQVREAVDEFRRQCAAPLLNAKTAPGARDLESLWNDIVKEP